MHEHGIGTCFVPVESNFELNSFKANLLPRPTVIDCCRSALVKVCLIFFAWVKGLQNIRTLQTTASLKLNDNFEPERLRTWPSKHTHKLFQINGLDKLGVWSSLCWFVRKTKKIFAEQTPTTSQNEHCITTTSTWRFRFLADWCTASWKSSPASVPVWGFPRCLQSSCLRRRIRMTSLWMQKTRWRVFSRGWFLKTNKQEPGSS